MTKLFGKINLISLLIPTLALVVIVLGIWLSRSALPKPAKETPFPPKLQTMIAQAVSQTPDAPWVAVLANNEMQIAYVPKEQAFVVTIYHPIQEESVKNGVREYLTGLGVSDFSNLKITYRTKPVI